ncbi:MAG: hypothetical protein ACR2QC_05355 [Gammaproteobacteria bacterium]
MFKSLYSALKFAFCGVVLGAIFALTGAAFAAENFADADAADKNAAESESGEFGISYSDFSRYGDFNLSTKTDSFSHPFSLNAEPFDLPADEFGAAEGGGGLIEFLSSPLGGFVIAAGIFAGATAIDKNNRDDNTPSASGGENGGGTTPTNPTTPQQCTASGEISDGSGGCRCDTANNYVDDGNGNCVMQTATPQCTAPGEISDGSGGCQCDTANNYVDDGTGTCMIDAELALRAMCATDPTLERRIFARPGAGESITGATGATPGTAALSLSIRAINAIISPGSGGNTYNTAGADTQWFRADYGGTGTLVQPSALTSDGLPRTGSATLTVGMLVAVVHPFTPGNNIGFDDIFIVYADDTGELFLARNVKRLHRRRGGRVLFGRQLDAHAKSRRQPRDVSLQFARRIARFVGRKTRGTVKEFLFHRERFATPRFPFGTPFQFVRRRERIDDRRIFRPVRFFRVRRKRLQTPKRRTHGVALQQVDGDPRFRRGNVVLRARNQRTNQFRSLSEYPPARIRRRYLCGQGFVAR